MHANLDVVNEVVRELIERTRERTRELLEHAKDGETSFIGPVPRRVVRDTRSMDDAVRGKYRLELGVVSSVVVGTAPFGIRIVRADHPVGTKLFRRDRRVDVA